MSWPIVFGCLWVLASTVVALMPMQHQYRPGLALLIVAPLLLIWIGYEHGFWLTIVALVAFVSMFRNPLRYFWKRFQGVPVELPKEIRDPQK